NDDSSTGRDRRSCPEQDSRDGLHGDLCRREHPTDHLGFDHCVADDLKTPKRGTFMKPRSTIATTNSKQASARSPEREIVTSREKARPQADSVSPKGKARIGISPEALSI